MQLITFAVFVGVVAIVYGAYWLLVVREEDALLNRLKPRGGEKKPKNLRGMLKPEERGSVVPSLDRALAKAGPFSGSIQTMLEQSGSKMTLGSYLLLSVSLGLGVGLFVYVVTPIVPIAVGFGVFAGWVPTMLVRRARTKRMMKFEEQFPEAIDLIARALRAGHALPTGLGMVADEMRQPVGTEFRILYDEQNFGLTLPDAMRNFARRIPVLDARFFVTAVLTQRETGGNLAEVLDNLAQVIRDRFKVKRQIQVISAHGRITGWVLACLPPALAAATLLLNPDHLGTLFGDPVGIRMIIVAIFLQVVGTLIMRRITDIEY